jgi:hypothetical protein
MTTEFSAEELKVIEKIEKLLALASSSNEHEAKLAAEKAAELLTIYNLTVEQVNVSKEKYLTQDCMERLKSDVKDKYIGSILEKYFFIRIIYHRHFNRDIDTRTTIFQMIGTKTNLKIATFVLSFLNRKFPELFEEYREANMAPGNARQSYYLGLHHGLCEQLEQAKTRAESHTGLMVVKDAALDKYIDDKINPRSASDSSMSNVDRDAITAGKQDGKALKIGRGLESNSVATERGRLLK